MGHVEEFLKDLQEGPKGRPTIEIAASATSFEGLLDNLIAQALDTGADSDELALTLSRKAEKLLMTKSMLR